MRNFYKNLVIFSFLSSVALLCFIFYASHAGSRTSFNELAFSDFSLTDTSFYANVSFVSSGKSLRSLSHCVEDESLYITVLGGLANNKYPKGRFDIDIRDDLSSVGDVYLMQEDESILIFSREQP
ncbi:hypothetical protein [Filifactor villosus]|uniref:Uncharacterized protein n=1 Tax=Filifactor villosus TaxID=29374 RepID=A0ABV9QIL5_9FIRM